MIKHTPGPWTVISDTAHYHTMTTVVGGNGTQSKYPSMQMIIQIGGHAEIEELHSNASLIAAVPDLLKALTKAVKRQGFSYEELIEALAAIAKATGSDQ